MRGFAWATPPQHSVQSGVPEPTSGWGATPSPRPLTLRLDRGPATPCRGQVESLPVV